MTAWVSSKSLDQIVAEIVEKFPLETGGVLMGYFTEDGSVVIAETIGPGPKARHGKSSFSPDHEWQEQEIARIYFRSCRTITYLGDWHSHPRGDRRLSNQDGATLVNIAMSSSARVAAPLMLVIPTTRRGISNGLSIWRYVSHDKDSVHVHEIQEILPFEN